MSIDITPLFVSLKTTIVATAITFGLGVLSAWWMGNYRGPGKRLIDLLFMLPLVLPPTVVGFFLLMILGKNGPVGSYFFKIGAPIIFSWPATVIAATIVAFPLMYKTAAVALGAMDANLFEETRLLGASNWQIFWLVALPVAWPGLTSGIALSFARTMGEFGATLMLAGNIPGRTQTIPLALFAASESGDYYSAMIWVLLMLGLSGIWLLGTQSEGLLNVWGKSYHSG